MLIDTARWPLTGTANCAICARVLVGFLDDANRGYECRQCGQRYPAAFVEQQIVIAVRERDWIVAQHTASRDLFLARWPRDPNSRIWDHVDRLVDHIAVGPTRIEVRWRPIAALPATSGWLGVWTGQPASARRMPDPAFRRAGHPPRRRDEK